VILSQGQNFSIARFGVVPSSTPAPVVMTMQAESAALAAARSRRRR
jgi:hypothetical protein